MPTAYLRCDSGSRASGRCSDDADRDHRDDGDRRARERRREAVLAALRAPRRSARPRALPAARPCRPRSAPAQSGRARRRRRRARAAPRAPRGTPASDEDGARRPASRSTPLRSHSSPNSSSATPITTCSGSSGIRASTTGPTTKPASASSTTAPAAPISASRRAALDGDREHDRHRLEQLERDRQRRAGEREQERGHSRFSPQKEAYGFPL